MEYIWSIYGVRIVSPAGLPTLWVPSLFGSQCRRRYYPYSNTKTIFVISVLQYKNNICNIRTPIQEQYL